MLHHLLRAALLQVLVFGSLHVVIAVWLRVVPPIVIGVRRLHLGAWGLALPGVILVVKGAPLVVLRHELMHLHQYRRYGFIGMMWRTMRHYGPGLWRRPRGVAWRAAFVRLWWLNPLEQEANRAMADTTPLPRCIFVRIHPRDFV